MADFQSHYEAKNYPYRVTSAELSSPQSIRHVSSSRATYRPQQHIKGYQPFAHRTVYFCLIGILTLGLIGALEYSVHVLPQGSFHLDLSGAVDKLPHFKRQELDPPSNSSATPDWSAIGPGDISIEQSAATSSVTSFQTNPGAYASGGALTTFHGTVVSAEPTSAYASGGAVTTFTSTLSTPTTVASAVVVTVQPGPSNTLTAPAVLTHTTYETVLTVATAAHTGKGHNDRTQGYVESNVPLVAVDQPQNYFLGVYAPVLIAIIIQVLVAYLYNCTRLMDSFNMLAKEEGMPLKSFFWNEHLGSTSPLAPVRVLLRRRWTLLWTSTIYGASQLLIAFASELVAIHPSYHITDPTAPDSSIIRGRALWINSILVRIIQGLLVFIFIQLINVKLLLRREKSALRSNPASIAAIASMVAHPEVAHDLMYIDQFKGQTRAIERIAERRYRLQHYYGPDGSECFGIVPVDGASSGPNYGPAAQRSSIPLSLHSSRSNNKSASASRRRRNDSLSLGLITASALTLFGIILAYYLNHDPTAFETFMDAQGFGPRFLLAVLALILKSPLNSFWSRTTAAVPFRRLASMPRRAGLDIVAPVPVYRTPLGTLSFSLRRNEWFASYLAVLAGLVVEVLLILLPGVPFHAQQFHDAALASWFGSLACLGLIVLGALAGWIKMVLAKEEWPHPPTTLGAVALYTAGTSLAADCASTDAILPPTALFDFKRRQGRWLVDYETEGGGEW